MSRTPGPWMIGERGWISRGCYSLVNPQGNIVACQIPSKDDAEFIREAEAQYPVAKSELEGMCADLVAATAKAGQMQATLREQSKYLRARVKRLGHKFPYTDRDMEEIADALDAIAEKGRP